LPVCYVVMLCFVILCYVMLCYVRQCCVMLCNAMQCHLYVGVAYSGECPAWVWRTLEYATTKEDCTLEFKSCLESVAAPTPAPNT